jgi:hypothetical protein
MVRCPIESLEHRRWCELDVDGRRRFGDANNVNPGDLVSKGYLHLVWVTDTGGAIYRSKDGQNWEPVMQGGFGSPENRKIEGLYTYEGHLYAHTLNDVTGIEVYRLVDSTGWVQVNEDGFCLRYPYNRSAKGTSGVANFKGNLYYGMLGDAETTQIGACATTAHKSHTFLLSLHCFYRLSYRGATKMSQ